MKQFILEVPEGYTLCANCPFMKEEFDNVCAYLYENNTCQRYNFSNINITEHHEN